MEKGYDIKAANPEFEAIMKVQSSLGRLCCFLSIWWYKQ